MKRGSISIVGGLLLALGLSGAALAAASQNALPPPDPTAANLTNAQIQARALNACVITQSQLLSRTQEEVRAPCTCYAQRTVRAMTRTELANFRATGYFDDTSREKALGFIDQCRLKRPI